MQQVILCIKIVCQLMDAIHGTGQAPVLSTPFNE